MRRAHGVVGLVALAAASAGCTKEPVQIAIDLPMSSEPVALSEGIVNGIALAVKDAGGKVAGHEVIVPDAFDDAVNGSPDQAQGADNMQQIVDDEAFVAVIGPLNSGVAMVEIPISNAAGLFQCSPSNTKPGLTLPEEGADDLRTEDNNYVRVVTTDAVQGPAAAAYLYRTLGVHSVYVADDTEEYGVGIADAFAEQFVAEGGTVVKRDGISPDTTDYGPILTAAAALSPAGIFFGGLTSTGAPEVLAAAVAAGLGDVPFMAGDGILDGPADADDTFLQLAGADADDAYSTVAAIGEYPGQAEFEAAYEDEYGEPPGSYSPMGYACAEVVLDAIERASRDRPADLAGFRAAVRTAGVDTSHDYDTVLGTFRFDANGDTTQKIISIYGFDPAGAGGAGDWAYLEQIDFGAPAR